MIIKSCNVPKEFLQIEDTVGMVDICAFDEDGFTVVNPSELPVRAVVLQSGEIVTESIPARGQVKVYY